MYVSVNIYLAAIQICDQNIDIFYMYFIANVFVIFKNKYQICVSFKSNTKSMMSYYYN